LHCYSLGVKHSFCVIAPPKLLLPCHSSHATVLMSFFPRCTSCVTPPTLLLSHCSSHVALFTLFLSRCSSHVALHALPLSSCNTQHCSSHTATLFSQLFLLHFSQVLASLTFVALIVLLLLLLLHCYSSHTATLFCLVNVVFLPYLCHLQVGVRNFNINSNTRSKLHCILPFFDFFPLNYSFILKFFFFLGFYFFFHFVLFFFHYVILF
jgi:hypothetical protein